VCVCVCVCVCTYVTRAGKMSWNANYKLQAKQVKNVNFGRIWGFHKNEFIKPSSSDPNSPNTN